MKKVIGLFAIAIALVSCSAEPIEMRTINPQLGVNVVGQKFTTFINDQPKQFQPEQKSIKFNPKENTLLIDGKNFQVVESTHYTITYKDNDNANIIRVIEFNSGYVFDGGSTQTKFDMYQLDMKHKYCDVYTYKN